MKYSVTMRSARKMYRVAKKSGDTTKSFRAYVRMAYGKGPSGGASPKLQKILDGVRP